MNRPDRAAVRAQLERMATSRVFASAGRMFPLLEHLVEAEIADASPRLSQRTIAIDVFGRDDSFDPTCDAIVRVEIGRLRNKLREYYATEGGDDPVIIDAPLGRHQALIRSRNGEGYRYPAGIPSQEIRHCRTPDGVTLAYSVIGEGRPLVMLPHWLSHLEADLKNPLIQHYWVELSRRFQLVRYDTRGFGLSDRDIADFDFDALVVDLETVIDAAGLDRVALLGPSGGAPVGTAYAARHPKRVSHLMLLGGFVRGPRCVGDPDTTAFVDTVAAMIRGGWGQPHSRFRAFFCGMLVPDGTPEQYKWMDDAQVAAASPENAERFYGVQCDFDLTPELANVEAPTLVFHGAQETGVPFSESEYAAARIPNARLIPLPTKNHLLTPDEPAWREFLAEVDRVVVESEV